MNVRTTTISILVAVALLCQLASDCEGAEQTDVCVYGGTPAGIAAAISAAKQGSSVLLVEPYSTIGGLMANGLSHSDFRTFEGLTGAFLDHTRRVDEYYVARYGADSPQAKGTFRGTHAEPHVNHAVFEAALAKHPGITVLRRTRLIQVQMDENETTRIKSVSLESKEGQRVEAEAAVFIDASYEGDLMAMAGVPYAVGREARATYGESLAPKAADGQLQGYNFRLIMTRRPELRVMPSAPEGYTREQFVELLPLLNSGQVKTVFCSSSGGLYKAQLPPLPNGKHDINDVSRAIVRLSLPSINNDWPDGSVEIREQLFQAHLLHNVGMLYFLQNDPEVPKRFREEAREWGWCRDEFTNTAHLPEQLYVREARRMKGVHIFTERDTEPAPNDARSRFHTDSIAMGDYSHNCHGTGHSGPRFGGRHTGEFYKKAAPYQIPYGTLLPRKVTNLLVPVAASSSHVGFCALRLEPIWMSLGQAAGVAAHIAHSERIPVQGVNVLEIQKRLHREGAATIYTSDVTPGHPDFEAVQWWGARGGLHGVSPPLDHQGQWGEHIHGQYFQAFPGHAVQLEKKLDDPLRRRWMSLARRLGCDLEQLAKAGARGEFIRLAFAGKADSGTGDSTHTVDIDSPIMLAGDWAPDDPHQIDYAKLPRVPAEHAIISDVREHAGTRVHQHAYLAHHDGRFWAMWSDGPGGPRAGVTPEQHRNVVPAHDMPGTRNSFATSKDGLHWSKPADLTGPPRKKGFGWIARGLWKRDGELLALASHFDAPGYEGLGLSLEAFRWNGVKWEAHGTVLDDSMNNFPPKRLPSGEWMMTRRDHQRQVSVMIGGTKAFDDWRINPLAAYDGNGRPEEPYWYILPDGKTIVGLIRDNGRSKFLLRTFSRDNGKTWSEMHRTDFPDATSKFFVHRTSRGYYVMVSNSNPRKRDPLTLAISEDGLVFTKLFWLIGGRHIDYPHIIEHDGHLLVAFSGAKQTMEVMKVSLDELERLEMPASVESDKPLPPIKPIRKPKSAIVSPSGFESKRFTLPNGRQMNRHLRPGKGPTLVLIPGTWGDLQTFAPLIAALPKEQPIAIIELCWQGGNVPPQRKLSIEQLADDVLSVIKQSGVEKYFISGHSIGGMIAVEIAGRPDLPGLLGAIPMEGWTHHTVAKNAFGGVVTTGLTPSQAARRQANRDRAQAHLTPQQKKAIVSIWRRWNGTKALQQSTIPILHIWGDRNRPRPDRKALQIPTRKSIELAWVPGSSHSLLIQAPAETAGLIENFIRTHR